MLNEEVAAMVSRFFDGGKGPSHDELTGMFKRLNLMKYDPLITNPGETIGKMKRCRAIFSYCLDNDINSGALLVQMILGAFKARGAFRETSEEYLGVNSINDLKEAVRQLGYELDPSGNLRTLLLDNLNGIELTDALMAYVRRAKTGAADAALVTGTGKDLLEATARHVMVCIQGEYPNNANFPMTLYNAFTRLNLGIPSGSDYTVINDPDPMKGVEKALFLLGLAVNRLRNAEGVGHGRPFDVKISDMEAKAAIEAMGLISEYLISKNNLGRNK